MPRASHKLSRLGAACLALLAHAGYVQAQVPSIVDLGYAKYQGVYDNANNVTNFLGVRYAAPPTGALRFAAPHPPAVTPGIQQANASPVACFQAGEGILLTNPDTGFTPPTATKAQTLGKRQSTTAGQSEDCLFLSVTIPGTSTVIDTSAKLPVVVWIHGGGYAEGEEADFPGTDLVVEAEGGIIAVTIQYRLGLFGFLAGEAVKRGGALNAGLLDQNFALKWVQKHISSFGGDPHAVTIWGESAGAGSVLQHVVAHGGATSPPLFQRAMTSSTYLPPQYAFNDSVPETMFSLVASQAGCNASRHVLECLRAVDASTFETINVDVGGVGFVGTFVLVPVVDGEFIVESPTATLEKGQKNGEILLSMTNTFEGTIFVSNTSSAASNTSLYISQLFPFLTDDQVQRATSLYATVAPDPLDQSITVMTDSIFVCPTFLLLGAFPNASFKGEFAIPPGTHGSDVTYYFETPGSLPPFMNRAFQQAFAQSFLSVVKNGNPNNKINSSTITPNWPFFADDNTQMLFNSTDGDATDSLPVVHTFSTDQAQLDRCAFWRSAAPQTAQ